MSGHPVIAKSNICLVKANQKVDLLLLSCVCGMHNTKHPFCIRASAIFVWARVRVVGALVNLGLTPSNGRMQSEANAVSNSRSIVGIQQNGTELLTERSVSTKCVVEHGI